MPTFIRRLLVSDSKGVKVYRAKYAYDHEAAATQYEKRAYYRGILGTYRKQRELAAVQAAIQHFDCNSIILDCPCGNGRWFEHLASRARRIIGVDIANAMLDFAKRREAGGVELQISLGDAESLDLDDGAVDHVFSYALMKHIPLPIQFKILKEFSRVSTGKVAVSFAILSPLSYPMWKWRAQSESYPIWYYELSWMATNASLQIEAIHKVGTPVGMETLIVFGRCSGS
jgi:ubiquinone/menaquinone biosynthesis C-methylase UbiE